MVTYENGGNSIHCHCRKYSRIHVFFIIKSLQLCMLLEMFYNDPTSFTVKHDLLVYLYYGIMCGVFIV